MGQFSSAGKPAVSVARRGVRFVPFVAVALAAAYAVPSASAAAAPSGRAVAAGTTFGDLGRPCSEDGVSTVAGTGVEVGKATAFGHTYTGQALVLFEAFGMGCGATQGSGQVAFSVIQTSGRRLECGYNGTLASYTYKNLVLKEAGPVRCFDSTGKSGTAWVSISAHVVFDSALPAAANGVALAVATLS